MLQQIKNEVNALTDSIIAQRRDLHKHAEAGWCEFRTSALAQQKMASLGYTITNGAKANAAEKMMGVPSADALKAHQSRAIQQGADAELVNAMTGGLTGFWAEMKFSDDDIHLALRFDMDSNDVTEWAEESHRPYKDGFASINNGMMHACGHDAHVAIGLALAEIVAKMKDQLKGTVRFIFQPAEEGLRGAAPMVAAGAVEGITHILGMHVGFQAEKAGMLICGSHGFLASTKLDVTFKGLSAHAGAYPQEGKNALLAACNAALNLHAIGRHSGGTTRINVGKIIAGEGRNVIPENAKIVLETRGLTSELNDYMEREARRIIEASALMADCSYHITVEGGSQSANSSREMFDLVLKGAKHVPYYQHIVEEKDFGAGEDFACMLSRVQEQGGVGTYMQVGIDRTAGHHNNKFDFDETGLIPAVELAAISVMELLKK